MGGLELHVLMIYPWLLISAVGVIIILALIIYILSYLKNPRKRKLQRDIIRKKEELKIINQKLELQHKDLNKSYENIRILSEFGQKLTATPDLESIHNMIYDYVSDLMDTSAFGIGIYNVDSHSIEYHSFYERGRKISYFNNPVTEENSLSAWCYKNEKEIFSNNFTRDFSHYIDSLSHLKTREIPQSLIYLPLKYENDILGTITVQSYRKDAYNENDLFILQLLASYVAIAIASAKTLNVLKYTQEKIVTQNFELLEHRENLEKLVNEKTKEYEEAKQKAEESDRLKSTFLANMSHDIRTPMNSILGFAELLSEEKLMEKHRMQYVEQIRKSSKYLLSILNDIIDISTLEAKQLKLRKSEFSLHELMKDLFEEVNQFEEFKEKEDITLNLKIPNEDLQLYSDPYRIRQIMYNFISNAIKYTIKGKISMGYHELSKDHSVEFFVEDTGIGIPKEHLHTIFDRFRRLDNEQNKIINPKGTGLGLAISKSLVSMLGGTIDIKSELNKGTRIGFQLPIN